MVMGHWSVCFYVIILNVCRGGFFQQCQWDQYSAKLAQPGGVTVRTLHLRSKGREFNSRSGCYQVDGRLSVDR